MWRRIRKLCSGLLRGKRRLVGIVGLVMGFWG